MSEPELGLRRALGYADLARRGFTLRGSDEEQVRSNARQHLVQRLGRLRGLPQKIGQLLSFSADEQLADDFRPLTRSLEPLPLDAIEACLASEWGCDPREVLDELEEPGLAASLGQVHRARLRSDGSWVAIKVQYPGVARAVEQDLRALGWLSAPLGDLRRGFDLSGYREEIRRDLEEELDYEREARQQERFAALCEGEPWIVPRVRRERCTPRVLVSDWVAAEPLEQVRASWPEPLRADLAFQLSRLFARTLLGEGFLHADPHPGNYGFLQAPSGPRIVLYDFGSVLELTRRERLALQRLIQAATSPGSEEDPLRLLMALGFDGELLQPLAHKLPALLSLLLLPYRQPMKFDHRGWDLAERVGDVLGEDRWNFRIAAPARLIFVMRAWQGFIHQLRSLETPVSWRIPAEPFLRRDQHAAAALELPEPPLRVSFGQLARHLRVEVYRDGVQKVKLSLPPTAADHLEDLLDPELRERIEGSVDLAERQRRIRQRAYAPQEVFSHSEGGRELRVWLE